MRGLRRDERGATAVLVAVLMSGVLLVSAAFAVDLGQQRVVRRDVQAVADVVALDMARELDGRKANLYNESAMDDVLKASLARNRTALGGEITQSDVTWEFLSAGVGGAWVTVAKSSTTGVPTAIRVRAKSDTSLVFGGVTGAERGAATRVAIASSSESSVCFSVGTNLLDLNTANNFLVQMLNGLLGIDLLDVSTSVVGPGGIVALEKAQIPLLDLSAALGVGTVDGLVTSTEPITIGSLLSASADVLRKDPANLVNLNAAAILDALALKATLATPTVVLSDILDLGPDPSSALHAKLGVLDLLNAVVYVAGKDAQGDPHAVGASLPLNLGALGTLDTQVTIIELPKITCGNPNRPGPTPVTASSAQIRLTTTLNLPAGSGLLTDLMTGLSNTLTQLLTLGGLFESTQERIKTGSLASTLKLTITTAKSTATLKSASGNPCSGAGGVSFDVLPSILAAGVNLDLAYTVEQRKKQPPLYLTWGSWTEKSKVNATLLGLVANVGDPAAYPVTLSYAAPPSEDMPQHTKAVNPLNLQFQVTSSDKNFIGGIVGDLLTPVLNNLVTPVVGILNTALLPGLTDLLADLGIELGKTTLRASGRPGCGTPKLVG